MLNKQHIKLLYRAWKYRSAEKNEIDYLFQKIRKGETVFDVGAHKGAYSFWMRKAVGDHGKLVCFEPQEKAAVLLKRVFIRNKNVQIEQVALSDHSRMAPLFVKPQPGIPYEASLHHKYENMRIEEVTTTTLDDYCRDHAVFPSFIKLDVEGHEQNVVDGAVSVLKKMKPVLLAEIETRHIGEKALYALCNKIIDLGYAAYFFSGNKKLPFRQFNAGLHQNTEHINTSQYSHNFAFEPL